MFAFTESGTICQVRTNSDICSVMYIGGIDTPRTRSLTIRTATTIGWRKAHPAGDHWIDWYDGRDATEVMDAFHTQKARDMYQRLPESKQEAKRLLEDTTPPDSETQIAFRKLRTELEEEGWFERDMVHEFKLLAIWASLVTGAALTAHTVPVLSSLLLGLSMTNAGWLGHDYVHGVDDFSMKMRNFAAVAAGLDPIWWSDKHNKHHALSESFVHVIEWILLPLLFVY